MAFANTVATLPGVKAGADLSSSRHHFVVVDSSGDIILATSATAVVAGVLIEDPVDTDAATVVITGSTARVVSSAAIAFGDLVTTDGSGEAAVAASGNYIAGICVDASAAVGELCSVVLTNPGRVA